MRGEAGLYRRVTPSWEPGVLPWPVVYLYGRGNRSCVPPKDTAGLPAVFPQPFSHSYKPTSEFGGPCGATCC